MQIRSERFWAIANAADPLLLLACDDASSMWTRNPRLAEPFATEEAALNRCIQDGLREARPTCVSLVRAEPVWA